MSARIGKILEVMETSGRSVACVAIVIMMLSTVADATLRYLFKAPIPGIYELNGFLLVALGCLTIAYAQRLGAHIRVDLVTSRIRGPNRVVMELIVLIIGLFLFSIATWVTGESAIRAFVRNDHVIGLVEFPLGPPMSLLPIGFGLLCLRLVADIWYCIRYLKQRSESRIPSKFETQT